MKRFATSRRHPTGHRLTPPGCYRMLPGIAKPGSGYSRIPQTTGYRQETPAHRLTPPDTSRTPPGHHPDTPAQPTSRRTKSEIAF